MREEIVKSNLKNQVKRGEGGREEERRNARRES
jgi:hypothetical protein